MDWRATSSSARRSIIRQARVSEGNHAAGLPDAFQALAESWRLHAKAGFRSGSGLESDRLANDRAVWWVGATGSKPIYHLRFRDILQPSTPMGVAKRIRVRGFCFWLAVLTALS